jgi:hypothetical protein
LQALIVQNRFAPDEQVCARNADRGSRNRVIANIYAATNFSEQRKHQL